MKRITVHHYQLHVTLTTSSMSPVHRSSFR